MLCKEKVELIIQLPNNYESSFGATMFTYCLKVECDQPHIHSECWALFLQDQSVKYKIIGMPTKKMTTKDFKDQVFDYEKSNEWNFKGDKPAIIDFYADWCGPCRAVAPVLEQLSEEFKGQIDIYKVDTDAEQELSAAFGIRSIPSILFIPTQGQPMMQAGALPKHVLKDVIKKELLAKQEDKGASGQEEDIK